VSSQSSEKQRGPRGATVQSQVWARRKYVRLIYCYVTPPLTIDQVRVNLGGSARMDEEGNVIPGKMIDMLVDGDDVFLVSFFFAIACFVLNLHRWQVEGPEDLIKVDSSTAIQPSIGNTWVINIVRGLLRKVTNGRRDGNPAEESDSDDASISETSASGYDSQSAKGRRAAMKAGGMRRKAVRNRNR